MSTSHPTRSAAPPDTVASSERCDQDEDARSDRMLARQEAELRSALAKIQALRHKEAEMTRRPDGEIVRALFAEREAAASRVATLTPREHEVQELILAGFPNKVIAWELGISQRTVENHRAAIMHRTGTKSVPALARLAIAAAWNGIDASPLQPLSTTGIAGARHGITKRVVLVDFSKR